MSGWVLEPAGPAAPVVACVPHGGLAYPAELTSALAVRPEILWSDWLTRELYEFLPELGITTIATGFSRFVADVNRDPGGEQHGGFWTSVVAARMPNGRPIYARPLTAIQVELNQRRYLDLEQRRYPQAPPRGDFSATQQLLRAVLTEIAGRAGRLAELAGPALPDSA